MQINIIILIIILLIYLIIREFENINKEKTKKQVEYRYLEKPIYDKYIKDINNNDIIVQNNIYNKMFKNPSPWMLSRGIGVIDTNDYRLKL